MIVAAGFFIYKKYVASSKFLKKPITDTFEIENLGDKKAVILY